MVNSEEYTVRCQLTNCRCWEIVTHSAHQETVQKQHLQWPAWGCAKIRNKATHTYTRVHTLHTHHHKYTHTTHTSLGSIPADVLRINGPLRLVGIRCFTVVTLPGSDSYFGTVVERIRTALDH